MHYATQITFFKSAVSISQDIVKVHAKPARATEALRGLALSSVQFRSHRQSWILFSYQIPKPGWTWHKTQPREETALSSLIVQYISLGYRTTITKCI